jgi:hypothetical protein
MRFNDSVKQTALARGIVIEKAAKSSEVEIFIKRFRENYVSVNLTRIGGEGDGGYLMPNVLESVSHCFSPGVNDIAHFEAELSKDYGIKSFLADASVSKAPLVDENFQFIKKFLGSRTHGDFVTLSDWMAASLDGSERELVLQMDIEGGEYDVLTFESEATLSRFSVMAFEFHSLQSLFDRNFLKMITAIFEKIYKNFSVCHVHPNNCCGIASLNGVSVPKVIEVTFVRNDVVKQFLNDSNVSLPHDLDRKNVSDRADIMMPDPWWR